MSTTPRQRLRREYDKPRRFAVAATQTISMGDCCWRDDSLSPKSLKAASDITYTSLAQAQAAFAAAFICMAAQTTPGSNSGEAFTPIEGHTAGIAEFDCASTTWEYGQLVGMDDNVGGTALLDQQVIAVTDPALAIGRVAQTEATAVTLVLVELFPPLAQSSSVGAEEFSITHTVTAAEDTAGTLDIDTGLGVDVKLSILHLAVTTNESKTGVDITQASGVVTIADGTSTNVVEGDVIHLIAKI